MSNRFFIGILVAIAAVFGVIFFTSQKSDNGAADSEGDVQPSSHIKGSPASGVVLVEYGDFQCPACGQYYPIVKQVYEKYQDQIQFQFRNFPLLQIHPNAQAAHRAAEAAGKQDKFFEMHDKLYETQQQWSSSTNPAAIFETFASELGLNLDTFKQDVASATTNRIINADVVEGQKAGANSTPTFVLDGVKIENPRDIEGFNKLIDEAIAKIAADS